MSVRIPVYNSKGARTRKMKTTIKKREVIDAISLMTLKAKNTEELRILVIQYQTNLIRSMKNQA